MKQSFFPFFLLISLVPVLVVPHVQLLVGLPENGDLLGIVLGVGVALKEAGIDVVGGSGDIVDKVADPALILGERKVKAKSLKDLLNECLAVV